MEGNNLDLCSLTSNHNYGVLLYNKAGERSVEEFPLQIRAPAGLINSGWPTEMLPPFTTYGTNPRDMRMRGCCCHPGLLHSSR